MSPSTKITLLMIASLSGCIWISRDAYVEAMGCDPDSAVSPDALLIGGDIDTADIGEMGGVSLIAESDQALGARVATVGALQADGVGRWAAGGNGLLLLGEGAPDDGVYPLEISTSATWVEVTRPGYLDATDAGAMDADGVRDLLLSAVSDSGPVFEVYLLSGAEPLEIPDEAVLTDAGGVAFKAASVVALSESAMAGAPQGDGYSGVLIAAMTTGTDGFNCLGDDQGAIFWLGPNKVDAFREDPGSLNSGEATAAYVDSEEGTSQLGCVSVARAGDVDGEGGTDIIVGAPSHDQGASDAGVAFLIAGEVLERGERPDVNDPDAQDVLWRDSGSSVSLVGYSVAAAGDVDGDGYDDVLVGTAESEPDLTPGEVRLYRGASSGPFEPMVTFTAGADVNTFGEAVTGGGDLDSDSRCTPDIVIGGTDSKEHQAVWVFLGDALVEGGALTTARADRQALVSLGATAPVTGAQPLARPADLDGDGYADLLLGAPAYAAAGGRDQGAAHILFGGPAR